MFGIDGPIMKVLNWISRLLYLQMLWVLFSLLGLVIGGVFPATFTTFGIARKWIREHTDYPLFSTFWKMYKESFLKANVLGWFMALFGYSIYFYFRWLNELSGVIPTILFGMLFALTFVYVFVLVFTIPSYVHFDVGLIYVVKNAAITALSRPFHVVLMLIVMGIYWYLMVFLPVIFFFFGVSTLSYTLMLIANTAFESIKKKIDR